MVTSTDFRANAIFKFGVNLLEKFNCGKFVKIMEVMVQNEKVNVGTVDADNVREQNEVGFEGKKNTLTRMTMVSVRRNLFTF